MSRAFWRLSATTRTLPSTATVDPSLPSVAPPDEPSRGVSADDEELLLPLPNKPVPSEGATLRCVWRCPPLACDSPPKIEDISSARCSAAPFWTG